MVGGDGERGLCACGGHLTYPSCGFAGRCYAAQSGAPRALEPLRSDAARQSRTPSQNEPPFDMCRTPFPTAVVGDECVPQVTGANLTSTFSSFPRARRTHHISAGSQPLSFHHITSHASSQSLRIHPYTVYFGSQFHEQ